MRIFWTYKGENICLNFFYYTYKNVSFKFAFSNHSILGGCGGGKEVGKPQNIRESKFIFPSQKIRETVCCVAVVWKKFGLRLRK